MSTTNELYGKRIRVRLDGESLIVAEARSRDAGMSLSEYIRRVLNMPVDALTLKVWLDTPAGPNESTETVRRRFHERLMAAREEAKK